MKLGIKVYVAFALGLLILVVVGVRSFIGVQQVTETHRNVAKTEEVLEKLEHLLSLLKDAETGQRGFVLTGEERYLEPYNRASGEIRKDIDSLIYLTKDDPAQQQSIQRLVQLSGDKLDEVQETIRLRREGGLKAALPVIRSDRGKHIMDEIREVVAQLESREWQMLDKRKSAAGEAALNNSLMVGIGFLLSLLMLSVAAVVITRTMGLAEHRTGPDGAGGKWPGIAIRYTFASAMVALAMLVRHWLVSSYGPLPTFVIFYPAILLVASIAGGGPGIIATTLSVLAAAYWYFPPFRSFAISSPNDAIALGIFGGASLFLCLLAERLRRARWAEAVSVTQEQELALQDMGNLLALDLDRRIVRWSAGCCSLYGFDAREAQGQLADELLRTQSPQPLEQIQRHLLEHGHWQGELTRCDKDGTELSLVILLALRRDEQGKPSAILEVSTDITSQKKAEAALRGSEARLQTAYDDLEVVNVELQAQTEELQAQSEELQAQSEELQTQNEELARLWEESKRAEDALKTLNEGLENRVEERTEELTRTVATLLEEILEKKRAEESLQRLNRLYAVLSKTNLAISRTKDRDNLFKDFCRIAVEEGSFKLAWVGLVEEESGELKVVAANGATDYLEDIRITANQEPTGLGPTGIVVREGTYYICNDFLGSPITLPWHDRGRAHGIRASASIALKQEGRVIGALTLYADKKDFFDQQQIELLMQMGTDVSFALDNIVRETRRQKAERALSEETAEKLRAVEALREKEQLLIQQSRQAAMGEMIGNIAHQWRQPLNALGLTVQQLPLFYDIGEFSKELLDNSVSQSMELIQHMSKTIDDFRNYFRPDKEKVNFNLSESIADTLSLVNASFKKENIDIEVIAKNDSVIFGYRNEFAQVLLNILNNARDALTESKIADPRVTITIGSESERAVVAIADNAGGIAEDIMNKIFDPYFTTKGPQAGTGVGLFMSKTIIEKNMGGKLTVRNRAGGAEFRIEV
jgi:PAS domain S-box-containing protein